MEAIGKKVDPLSQKLEQDERRIAELDEKLDELRKQETAVRARPPRDAGSAGQPDRWGSPVCPRPAGIRASTGEERREPASLHPTRRASRWTRPANPGEPVPEKQYGEAYAVFRKLLQSQPDDARLWYYAALSYGLSNGDWGRMTQSMVDEGIAREKAGKPPKSEIDADSRRTDQGDRQGLARFLPSTRRPVTARIDAGDARSANATSRFHRPGLPLARSESPGRAGTGRPSSPR